MTDRVMLDIETLGTDPGCAILSVGAVRFNEDELGEEFYKSVDLRSCEDAGLGIDGETLEWWLGQDESVRDVLVGGEDINSVLWDFRMFYSDADEIWAFSPSFDCDILAYAFEAVGESPPWSYRDERCARTLAALPIGEYVEQDGDAHNALDDAKHQARTASKALARLSEELIVDV